MSRHTTCTRASNRYGPTPEQREKVVACRSHLRAGKVLMVGRMWVVRVLRVPRFVVRRDRQDWRERVETTSVR
eukprot:829369-Rhodomonas_salina.2